MLWPFQWDLFSKLMQLKILLWNLQDFYVFMDHYDGENLSDMSNPKWQLLTSSFKTNKDLSKIIAMRDLINKLNPDICLFTEVAGHESLSNFNEYFLNNNFEIIHSDSNSDRGIDLGVLVSKGLQTPLKHKYYRQKVFARGVQELRLSYENLELHIYLTHLKSKLNIAKKDFEGRGQRQLEVEKICDIISKNSSDGHEHIFAGDLNGIIFKEETEAELALFAKNLRLIDALETINRPYFDRATYFYYNKHNEMIPMQLDYFLLSEGLNKKIEKSTGILDFDGRERVSFPKNLAEKRNQPSDHYPYFLELKIT